MAGRQIPTWLADLLERYSNIRWWLVTILGAIDPRGNTPPVRQLCDNPITAATTRADYYADYFNNPEMYTNTVVIVGNQEIFIHKFIIAQACKALATQWEPLWARSDDAMVLKVFCEATGRDVSYAGALMFFEFLYTGEIRWPDVEPDAVSAFELLVLACTYDVPFLVCAAEMVLRPAVDFDNCCSVLAFADHYHIEQLRAYCLHFTRAGYRHVRGTQDYQNLNIALRSEVQQGMR